MAKSVNCYLISLLDINECKNGTYICPENSSCENTEGSFECKCNRKYIKVMDGDIMKCIGKIPLLIKVELCRFKQYFC